MNLDLNYNKNELKELALKIAQKMDVGENGHQVALHTLVYHELVKQADFEPEKGIAYYIRRDIYEVLIKKHATDLLKYFNHDIDNFYHSEIERALFKLYPEGVARGFDVYYIYDLIAVAKDLNKA